MATILEEFLFSVGILTIFAFLGGFIATRWRQPTVIGLLAVGAIIGPNALGIIKGGEIIDILSDLGAALLLFSIGIEFSLPKIMGSGVRAVIMASAIMLTLFVFGYEIGVVLGLDYVAALAIGACMSFSSTAIFIRMLAQQKLLSMPQIPLLISVLVLEDIVAVGAITFFSTLGVEKGPNPANSILFSMLFSLSLMGFAYLVIRALLKRLVKYYYKYKADDSAILLGLGLCLLMSFLASMSGLSPSIGAFLAGSILAGLPIREEIEREVAPLSLAFSSFFFISIGLLISPQAIMSSLPAVLMISLGFSLVAFFITGLMLYLDGKSFEQSVLGGAAMAVLGEFSLLLAKEAGPAISGIDLVSTMAFGVFATTLMSSLMISRRVQIAKNIERLMPKFWMMRIERTRAYTTEVFAEFEGNGAFLNGAKRIFATLKMNFRVFAIAGIALIVSRRMLHMDTLDAFGYSIHVPTAVLVVSAIAIAPAVLDLLSELKLFVDTLASVFVRTKAGDVGGGRRIVRNVNIAVILALLAGLIPLLVDILMLPDVFHFAVLVPLFGLALVAYDTMSCIVPALNARMKGEKDEYCQM